MTFQRLLIANRGEIAIRIVRAASALGIQTITVCSEDDAGTLHTRKGDEVRQLSGIGVVAYLDQDQILQTALDAECDAIHPGYGFLSENAGFAERCRQAGVAFVGPRLDVLTLFGDKSAALTLAKQHGVPTIQGTTGPTTLEEAREFMQTLGKNVPVMIKAIAGGGGRGMRRVQSLDELESAYERCRSEAKTAFGRGDLYLEQLITRARHVEVQLVGDRTGAVVSLGDRDCTAQRRNQKLVEIAPSPYIAGDLRGRLLATAVTLGRAAGLDNLATVEFLVSMSPVGDEPEYVFIEANPRLQVEHTVTEAVYGLDLVTAQLELAAGATLSELQLDTPEWLHPHGTAIQLRITTERMLSTADTEPPTGSISAFDVPSGAGIRIETAAHVGYMPNPRFDSLLAKLIVHTHGDFDALCRQAYRALCELHIVGVDTNVAFLQRLVLEPNLLAKALYTSFVDDNLPGLFDRNAPVHPRLYLDQSKPPRMISVGATVDANDPLAVLAHGKSRSGYLPVDLVQQAEESSGMIMIRAPMQGTVVSIDVAEGDHVSARQQVVVMDAMKMEHLVQAPTGGKVRRVLVGVGDTVPAGQPIAVLEASGEVDVVELEAAVDLDRIRPDLQQIVDRRARTLDNARPAAVASRRALSRRTARENVTDLVDPGSFIEYGQLVLAAQRRTRSLDELIARTPADGLITGIGSINGSAFGPELSRCAVLSYDYTVLAGTQGQHNHRKHDRMFEIADKQALPVVFFTEGGGGRGGDTDGTRWATMRTTGTFRLFAKLSGRVPLVAVVAGFNFAGSAALVGGSDVVIATADATIGMGGPALVEGGGLGVYRPEEIGSAADQVASGVIDILVRDETEAVAVARQYVSYFQGRLQAWEEADQRPLRNIVPENRRRSYDVRRVIETVVDQGTYLELRPGFGRAMVTALARIKGRPVGIIANNAAFESGAINSDGADKAARLMQLCDAFDIPVVSFCDTPGIMVGPEAERTGLVRHCNRMFVVGANLTVPLITIVLRKAVGLGAMAMSGGNFQSPSLIAAWPTGEFAGMGIEGSVKLGNRAALLAIEDVSRRKARYDELVTNAYAESTALNHASLFEIDDVIDPADTRDRVAAVLETWNPPPLARRDGKKRGFVDTW